MATKTCIKCGAQFESKGPAKYCLACRMKGYANYKHKPKTVSEAPANTLDLKDDLDKKLDDLHAAGTTYAAAQKAETLANIPKIEVPEHLLRVETPEAPKLIAREAVDKERKNAAEAAWRFARAIIDLPGVLGDQLLALSYEDAVMEAKHLEAILADALGIE